MEFKAGLLYSFPEMWHLSQLEFHIRFITYIAVSKWLKILFLQSMLNNASGLLRNSGICHKHILIMKINYRWRMLFTTQWKMHLLYRKPENPVWTNPKGPRVKNLAQWRWIIGSGSNSSGRITVDFEKSCYFTFFKTVPNFWGIHRPCLTYISSVYRH